MIFTSLRENMEVASKIIKSLPEKKHASYNLWIDNFLWFYQLHYKHVTCICSKSGFCTRCKISHKNGLWLHLYYIWQVYTLTPPPQSLFTTYIKVHDHAYLDKRKIHNKTNHVSTMTEQYHNVLFCRGRGTRVSTCTCNCNLWLMR